MHVPWWMTREPYRLARIRDSCTEVSILYVNRDSVIQCSNSVQSLLNQWFLNHPIESVHCTFAKRVTQRKMWQSNRRRCFICTCQKRNYLRRALKQ